MTNNPRTDAAAQKAAAMWPDSASVIEARKRAEAQAKLPVEAQNMLPAEAQAKLPAEAQDALVKMYAEKQTTETILPVEAQDMLAKMRAEKQTAQANNSIENIEKEAQHAKILADAEAGHIAGNATGHATEYIAGNARDLSDNQAEMTAAPHPNAAPTSPHANAAPTSPHVSPQFHAPVAINAPNAPNAHISNTAFGPNQNPKHKRSRKPTIIAICIVAIIAIIAALVAVMMFLPIHVTVNNQDVELSGTKTLAASIEKAGLNIKPGNLLAIDGSVIEEGGGDAFSATVNGQHTSDGNYILPSDAVIEVADGTDVTEDFTITTEAAPYSATIEGTGAIHKPSGEGIDGEQEVKTGNVSGVREITITENPTNITCTNYNADGTGEKVIALTFDDGPNADYTPKILDVLKENGAVATFFTVGNRITSDCTEIVKRAYDEGNQICTHSWDHASGSGQGVNLSYMTPEEQVNEILKGYEAIENAIGIEASHVIRTPGGNFPPDVIANLAPYITAEIGWNIDTNDWRKPGTSAITSEIMKAKSGSIILMHDGGGDRSQTVQALAAAIPELKRQGYKFVTIDQLLGS